MIWVELTPMIYTLADALEIDMNLDFNGTTTGKLRGSNHVTMEVFEGYSPTVVSEITDTIIDKPAGIIAVCARIWGNLSVMCINDNQTQNLSLYVYDKSKVVADSSPWIKRWSREHAYKYLGPCIKGIYWRPTVETKWNKLSKGSALLKTYNDMRKSGYDSGIAYRAMWGAL